MRRIDTMTKEQIEDAYESSRSRDNTCDGCIKWNDEKYNGTYCCVVGTCDDNIKAYLEEEIDNEIGDDTYCCIFCHPDTGKFLKEDSSLGDAPIFASEIIEEGRLIVLPIEELLDWIDSKIDEGKVDVFTYRDYKSKE